MGGADSTRWLDEGERAAWLNIVRTVVRLPAELDAQLIPDSGLNYFEYMVMAMLSERRPLPVEVEPGPRSTVA